MAHFLQRLALGAAAISLGFAVQLVSQQQQQPQQQPQRSPRQPVSVKFSHAFHAKFGDVAPLLRAARDKKTHLRSDGPAPGAGCQACHSGIAESDHKNGGLAMMADCLVCHTKIDPPFSCAQCHSQAANELKPAYHEGGFADKHSTGLAKMSLTKEECAVCHGRKFTCLGCH